MDYGKYKFDAAQRARESRRKTSNVSIKEMKYRPKIGSGDFDTKTRKVAHFLGEGHKVKITIMFRGREMSHPELGKKILDRVAEDVVTVGKVELSPKLDGRNMIMVLAPDRRAQAAAAHSDKAEAAGVSPIEVEPEAQAASTETIAPTEAPTETPTPTPAPEPEPAPEPATQET
jgi:translation initiation factor IF-3